MSQPLFARLRQQTAVSLWIVPAAAGVSAIVLAKLLAYVDHRIGPQSAWYLFAGHADSGRDLLSAIANSLMTFTGVVFSITILVLQLASSQYSPRVLRTFLEDRFTRFALGVFVGSFVYAMALLPEVRSASGNEQEFVPRLAIFVGFLLVLLSVAVFVRYLHNVAHSIRADHIVARVADETRHTIDQMFGDEDRGEGRAEPVGPATHGGVSREIAWRGRAGILSIVEADALIDLASRRDLVVEILAKVGDFVPRGRPLFRVWGGNCGDDEIAECVLVAEERSAEQDPAFGFRQLVDVAARALSSGVNDPTTAVQALDQLHDLLRALAPREFPRRVRRDAGGTDRLLLSLPSWDDYVDLAFDEIRHYGRGSPQVVRRLQAVIDDLLAVAPGHRKSPLQRQLRLLEAARLRGFDSAPEQRRARKADRQGA